jgi:iron complex outermembrane receptor protein
MFVSALVSPCGVVAQDRIDQTVVVTAAATPAELGSVPRTVVVITREEIAALPVHSVADVLRLAASVDVRARGERGVQTDFAVRGAGFGQMLVLVDGTRLNDAQSGHHNGDVPVPLDAVERIEILLGPGSSLYGADAFGGTVNVITRRAHRAPQFAVRGGSFDAAGVRGGLSFGDGTLTQTIDGAFDRSSGFMYDRDHETAIVRSRTALGASSAISVSFLRKEFGANNFYGGNAPSREWTNQALIASEHRLGRSGGWTFGARAAYRTHGDRFVFNQTNPALSDNRHRTHAALGAVTGTRTIRRGDLTAGFEGGGDWIRSSNLGDHAIGRTSGFAEWRQALGTRVHLDAALRADRYSEFGSSWSPSAGIAWWVSSAVRLRASAGRAFRIPTFTERYYSDPANLARADVGPERAWAGEGGLDLFLPGGLLVQGTVFGRADGDVIDWLRPTVAERWQTYNVRDVDTRGLEVGMRKSFRGGFVLAQVTGLDVDAPAVTQLSKYALDYASRSFVAASVLPLPAGFRVAPRFEYRRRQRPVQPEEYVLLDVRISRALGEWMELSIDGTNLFDRRYHEIAGVPMPGAAFLVGLTVSQRPPNP